MANTLLSLRRSDPSKPMLNINLGNLMQAETRLKEVAYVTPVTAMELSSFFNEVCNEANKYSAWIEYEILQAEKNLDLIRATIILDDLPEKASKLKESGQKPNEEWRKAVMCQDSRYQQALDVLNSMKAAKSLISAKGDSFKRAFYAARNISTTKDSMPPSPNMTGMIGHLEEPQANFMGATQFKR